MLVELAPNSIPLFIALLLAGSFSIHLWVHRRAPETFPVAILLAFASLWILGAALEINASSYVAQNFWFRVELTGRTALPVCWLIFILPYTGDSSWRKPRHLFLLAIPAGLAVLALWSNDWHHLYWTDLLNAASRSPALMISSAPFYRINALIDHGYILGGLALLLRNIFQTRDQTKTPVVIIILCTLVPWGTNLYYSLLYLQTGYKEPFPYIFSFGFVLFVYALIRLNLLKIIPIALDNVVAAMNEAVIVLSLHGKIVHINASAEKILGFPISQVFDQPAQTVLAKFPHLVQLAERENDETITFQHAGPEGSPVHFEGSLSFVIDQGGNHTGKLITLEDITHRVMAEQASRESQEKLRRSEETYRQLVENINEIVFTLDCSGILTYTSPNVERVTGFAPSELVGKHSSAFLSPEDHPRLQQSFQRTLEGGEEIFEFRLTDRNGNIRTIISQQRRIEQQDGTVTGIQGMLRDVTDRIQVEAALERRAAQLSILNEIGEKIAELMDIKNVLDRATQLIQTSFGFYHVALFIPDPGTHELIMRSASGAFTDVFPTNHSLKFSQGMVGWVAENGVFLLANDVRREPRYMNLYPEKVFTRSELTVPVLLGDELVGVLDIQSPVLNAFDENDVRVIKTIANQIAIAIENARLYEEVRVQLTETERKENMLRVQRDLIVTISSATIPEEMLSIAVETLAIELNVPRVAVFIADAGSGCLNPAALFGFSETEIQKQVQANQGVGEWVTRSRQPVLIGDIQEIPGYKDSHPDTRSVLCVPLISGGEVIGIIYLESPETNVFKADDLRLLVILANNLVVLIERARLFLEVEQARSALEERASALEAANERLRELDRMKSHFLANMSHELRTPLNSIIGFSEILIDNLAGPLNTDQEDCVTTIHDSGKHLLALINDLLDFSKIEAGRMMLEPTTFEAAGLFDEVRSTILPLTEKKAQRLGVIVEENLPLLSADRLRLKQVFINLLSNANKFTPEGGEINMTCRIAETGQMLFSFQDTGIGIRPEHQDLIFEEFRQVDGSMSRQVSGSGLGLAISKRIVLLHHGSIWVESELGSGATFYVSMPIVYQGDMI